VLQCVACDIEMDHDIFGQLLRVAVRCSVFLMCCGVLRSVAESTFACCSALQCISNVLRSVAECCRVLQCVACDISKHHNGS